MKEIVEVINQEIKSHEVMILRLAKARSIIEGNHSTAAILTSAKEVEKLLPPRSKQKSKTRRTETGVMRTAVLKVLGKNGSMSVRNVVEAMRIDGYKFYRGSNRYSSVGSCLRRLESKKQIGVIKNGNAIVYTSKAEVFHPGSVSSSSSSGGSGKEV